MNSPPLKRIISVLTIYTFVLFLLTDCAVAENCAAFTANRSESDSESVAYHCEKSHSVIESDDNHVEHRHSQTGGDPSYYEVADDPCCVLCSADQERNAYLYEQHQLFGSLTPEAELVEYSCCNTHQFSPFGTVADTSHRVHCSIPVTVLLR